MAESLARTEILRWRRDVARARRLGTKTGTRFLSLRCAPRPKENSGTGSAGSPPAGTKVLGTVPIRRVAFLLPRGVGNAVARNRLKRRLREIYRRNKEWFPAGCDCLVQPTAAAGELSFAELLEEIRMATARIEQNSETGNQNSELRSNGKVS